MLNQTQDLVSVGKLAGELQHSVASIERAAEKLGIAPAVRINRVAHYSGPQAEQLAAELRGENQN